MKTYQLPIDKIISELGYEHSSNFFISDQIENIPLSLHFKKVLKGIHPYAVYVLNNMPFVLFFDKMINDNTSFKKVSKQVWNAQIPVTIFCDESTVKIFNGLSLNMTNYTLKQIETSSMTDCSGNSNFSYWKISNPNFWNQYIQNYSGTKLNQYLLDNISFLTNRLKKIYHIPFATKLVLRLIFIRYLIDRGVDLDYENFSADISRSQAEFLKIVKNKTAIYNLFAHLKTKLNGNLFELGTEMDCPELTEDVFILLHQFFSGREILNSRQLSLFALYDFNIIPVELISNIYEILLGEKKRDEDKAFYTPNYLVEYILDKTVTKTLKEKSSFVILDPSCGSGVFLVDSYRRIVQENLGEKIYCDNDTILTGLLKKNIYGIDNNEEAIDVTIFSLYLTILDYIDPKNLSEFILPNLKGENLFVSDFFDEEKLKPLTEKNIAFDYIIGNPPWGDTNKGLHMSYCKQKGYDDMQQKNEISRSFVFRARDFCTIHTTCCFILPSKLLYNQKSPAVRFRKFLLKETEIQDILELSPVRKMVFENANAPAVIVSFRYNSQNNLKHSFTYISLKPNIFFNLFHVICIEKNDIKSIPQSLLFDYDWAWKTIVYGFSHDIENIIRLKESYPAIKSILKSADPPMLFGSGIQDHLGDKQDASALVGLLNSSLFSYLNLLIGSSVGIEKEQRFMSEVLSFPYVYSPQIIDSVIDIQEEKLNLFSVEDNSKVKALDKLILASFGLESNKFVDYALHVTIPELTGANNDHVHRIVSVDELKEYGKCFLNHFTEIYQPYGKYISVTLYPDIENLYTVFELHVKEEKPINEFSIVNESDCEKN